MSCTNDKFWWFILHVIKTTLLKSRYSKQKKRIETVRIKLLQSNGNYLFSVAKDRRMAAVLIF